MNLNSVACWVFGHNYRTVQVFSTQSRRAACDRCGSHWAMNDRVRAIVPWTDEFESFYREHGHIIKEGAQNNG